MAYRSFSHTNKLLSTILHSLRQSAVKSSLPAYYQALPRPNKLLTSSHQSSLLTNVVRRYSTSEQENLTENSSCECPSSRSSKRPKYETNSDIYTAYWLGGRILGYAQFVLIPAAFIYPSMCMDNMVSTVVMVHATQGMTSAARDYMRPNVVGKTLSSVIPIIVYGLGMVALTGLYYYNYNDIGLIETIKTAWRLGKNLENCHGCPYDKSVVINGKVVNINNEK